MSSNNQKLSTTQRMIQGKSTIINPSDSELHVVSLICVCSESRIFGTIHGDWFSRRHDYRFHTQNYDNFHLNTQIIIHFFPIYIVIHWINDYCHMKTSATNFQFNPFQMLFKNFKINTSSNVFYDYKKKTC